MDAKVAYWTAALTNMVVLTSFAIAGVRHIRRGEVARHKRAMTIAASLVGAFLVSYPIKLLLLGREDMATWSTASVWTLRFHELCVVAMVIGGAIALHRGLRLKRTRLFEPDGDAPPARPEDRQRHRLGGRIAVGGAILGALSATAVLVGMYGRL